MKLLIPVLGIGGLVLAVLYLNGSLPGFGSGADLPHGTPADLGPAQDKAEAFVGTPLFYTLLVSAGGATVGLMAWSRIGSFGRGLVLVAAAVAVTVLVIR